MAEFRRDRRPGVHGFPQASMFHQPDLEELLLARVGEHPLIDLRRGGEVFGLDGALGPLTGAPVRVHARVAGVLRTFTGPAVLGCDRLQQHHAGAGRDHRGRPWLHRTLAGHRHTDDARLDTWDGVEQVCDPVRPATFMQVTGDRYPLGVPAARRRGRSRPDHPAGSRPAAAALDRTRQPGRPEDHPHRELHLPRPAGVPLPGWADLARCLAARFAQPERVPGNLIDLDVRHARSLWSSRPFRMVRVSRSPEVRRGSRRPREPSRRRRPPRRVRPRCGHGR